MLKLYTLAPWTWKSQGLMILAPVLWVRWRKRTWQECCAVLCAIWTWVNRCLNTDYTRSTHSVTVELLEAQKKIIDLQTELIQCKEEKMEVMKTVFILQSQNHWMRSLNPTALWWKVMSVTRQRNRSVKRLWKKLFRMSMTKSKKRLIKIGPKLVLSSIFFLHFSIFLFKILNIASQLSCEAMLKIPSKKIEKCRRKLKKGPILVLSW